MADPLSKGTASSRNKWNLRGTKYWSKPKCMKIMKTTKITEKGPTMCSVVMWLMEEFPVSSLELLAEFSWLQLKHFSINKWIKMTKQTMHRKRLKMANTLEICKRMLKLSRCRFFYSYSYRSLRYSLDVCICKINQRYLTLFLQH